MNRLPAFLMASVVAVSALPAFAADPVPVSLAVYPAEIRLHTKVAKQPFIVVVTRDDGVTLDVTKSAVAKIEGAPVAKVEPGLVLPLADGAGMLQVEHAGLKASAPITVKDIAADPPISFHREIMPIFMRSGCNTGSCHGAARGKDGFRISLFGFDPMGDHFRITRELGTRRINLALPEESLLVEKSAGIVPHSGGKRFATDSEYYSTMVRWLREGGLNDAGPVAKVEKVLIYPPNAVLQGEGATQQFVAQAWYSDGTVRDVTNLAVFLTSNDNSAAITPQGQVTAGARGEAFIMARFDTHTVVSQVLVLPKDLMYNPPAVTGNYIDHLVAAKLKKLRIEPSPLCTDEEFLRRASIDIAGVLPTQAEYAAFMADAAPDKRAKLVDRLLDRKEFSEIWAMKWSEWLMVKSSNQVSYKAMFLYSNWLTDQIARNVPLDQMVRELLGATGGTFRSPATNYYQAETDTLKVAENVAQVFMGTRTQCAQCHNHPFDRWTMDDYYSFAAFFSQIGRKPGEDYRETIVFNSRGGEISHPLGGRRMAPKFLGGAEADVANKDRRAVVAAWLTAPDNQFFSPNVANRIWAHFFGQGIVEQVDDFRASNPPSNPELLKELAKRLVEYNYDFKRLVRDICNSEAYQRSTSRNPSNLTDERNFAHANVRRIPAEMALDCILQVTETREKFRGLPIGARAVQISDGTTSTYFLDTFGRSPRNTPNACEATTDPTLSQALHLLNGPAVHNKIAEGQVIPKSLQAGRTPPQLIEDLYVRCLSRKPTPQETEKLMAIVTQAENLQAGMEDVFWAILNSREFLFNH